jgi:hypothetical protein
MKADSDWQQWPKTYTHDWCGDHEAAIFEPNPYAVSATIQGA